MNSGRWAAAVNIGGNPTFGEQQLKIEAHLLDFDGPLYGEPVEVEFLSRLRDVRQFAGIDDLKQQLARDVAAARAVGQQETTWDER